MNQDREIFSLLVIYEGTKRRVDTAWAAYGAIRNCSHVSQELLDETTLHVVEAVAAHREAEDKLLHARARMKA